MMFLLEKRDGSVKARGLADGRKHMKKKIKEYADSPTFALGSIMIMLANKSHKGRDVATINIPGAYLNTDNDKYVIMLLRGRLT